MPSEKDTNFKFGKFITDIVRRESEGHERIENHLLGQKDLPQRKYNKLYRELWQNSTKYGRKN